jgi:hypothetical protein
MGVSGGNSVTWSTVPTSATATGTAGQIAYDGSWHYICTATNTWKRSALSAWPAVTPSTITGLQLWLDAGDSSSLFDATTGGSLVAADATVARWQDKSGNGRHATQSNSALRPIKKNGVQNGLSVLRFDGAIGSTTADRMQIASSTSAFNFLHLGQGAVFIVAVNGTTADYNDIRTWIDNCGLGASKGFYFGPDDRSASSRNNTAVALSGNQLGTTALWTPNDFVTMQAPKVYTAVVNNTASAASRLFLYKNGVSAGVTNSVSGSTTGDATYNMMIGSTAEDTGSFAFQGDFLEIIIYNSALSDSDRSMVETYLMTKWAIA